MPSSRSVFLTTFRLLTILALLFAILPVRASSTPALFLLEVHAPSDLQAFNDPILAQIFSPTGAHFLLAALSAEQAAALSRLKPKLLDPDSRGAAYYLLTDRHNFNLPEWLDPLYQDSTQAVARLSALEYQSLSAESRLLVRRLQPHTLHVDSDLPELPSEIAPLPVVQQIIDLVAPETVWSLDGSLSGEWSVSIGGAPYQIHTRYSRTEIPIQKATQYAYEFFESQMLATSYHTYTLPSTGDRRNVVAEQPGLTQPERIFLITAHLDSTSQSTYRIELAPGADDNASGSTAVLMAADILSNYLFDCTLRYVLFTGEEQGLYGSQAYAQDAFNNGDQIEAVLNLDMIGYNSDSNLTFELHTRPGNAADLAIANLFSDVIDAYNLPLVPQILQDGVQYSDHASFWQYGFPAIIGIEHDLDFTPYYHTIDDRLSTLDLNYFTAAVKAALGTFAHMGCLIEEPGSLTGRVTDVETEAALPGAQVTVSSSSLNAEDTANANGRYTFQLPADTYTVTVSAPDYYTATYTNVIVQPNMTTYRNAPLLHFPQYNLSGVVQDAYSEQPLAATLTVLEPVYLQTTSDPSTGAYTLTIPGGATLLEVAAPGYITQTHTLDVTGNQTGYDIHLEAVCQVFSAIDWSYSPQIPFVYDTVTFTAAIQGGTPPFTYTWEFGDGSDPLVAFDQPEVTHLYPVNAAPQAYTVNLSVGNACSMPLQNEQILVVQTHAVFIPVTLQQP